MLGRMFRRRTRSFVEPAKPTLRERLAREKAYEREGAEAFIRYGHAREDCPYDERTNSTAWNFWVYGNENARGRARAIAERQPSVLMSTAQWPTAMIASTEELSPAQLRRYAPIAPAPALSESTPKMPSAFDRKLDIDFSPPTEKDSK